MELCDWLARERARDAAEGLPATVSDPTALRLLAIGMTEAQGQKRGPVVPQDGR
jgi:hypothetical protein